MSESVSCSIEGVRTTFFKEDGVWRYKRGASSLLHAMGEASHDEKEVLARQRIDLILRALEVGALQLSQIAKFSKIVGNGIRMLDRGRQWHTDLCLQQGLAFPVAWAAQFHNFTGTVYDTRGLCRHSGMLRMGRSLDVLPQVPTELLVDLINDFSTAVDEHEISLEETIRNWLTGARRLDALPFKINHVNNEWSVDATTHRGGRLWMQQKLVASAVTELAYRVDEWGSCLGRSVARTALNLALREVVSSHADRGLPSELHQAVRCLRVELRMPPEFFGYLNRSISEMMVSRSISPLATATLQLMSAEYFFQRVVSERLCSPEDKEEDITALLELLRQVEALWIECAEEADRLTAPEDISVDLENCGLPYRWFGVLKECWADQIYWLWLGWITPTDMTLEQRANLLPAAPHRRYFGYAFFPHAKMILPELEQAWEQSPSTVAAQHTDTMLKELVTVKVGPHSYDPLPTI